MRKKIKQVLCMFSALVVMICCAVPAFADDTLSIDYVNNYPSFAKWIRNYYLSSLNINTDDYLLMFVKPSKGRIGGVFVPRNYISSNSYTPCISQKNPTSRLYYSGTVTIYSFTFVDWNKDTTNCRISVYPHTDTVSDNWFGSNSDFRSYDVCYSEFDIYDYDTRDIFFNANGSDPNAVLAPFTVTYTPELSLNMQNKIYYPSKGGANADENGLVAAENNNINLDIKLTPEFLKTFNEKDLGKAYGSGTYAVLCCLSKNLLNAGDDLQRFFDEDVVLYAMNHDGNYYKGQDDEKIKSDGSASDDLNSNDTVDTFEPYLTLYQGRTPIYTIPRDGKITVSFDLTSIDYKTHGLTDDSKLYVNVIGVFVKNNGHVTPQNGEKTEDTTSSTWLGSYAYQEDFTNLKTCEKIDDFVKSVDEETGKPETFKAYRVYSVISDPFSYEKFPDYVPKVYKDKDGNTYNPSTTKLKDLCNIPPSKVTDVDLAKGSDGVINDGSYMQPDDYNKYLDKKKINANFGSVDFTDIKSIFSTTGTYWDFLTAALSCLPSWFYAVFSAWFVLFLAIALIKLVLPT